MARRVPIGNAQGVTRCKRKAELQTLAGRDAMEAREDFWNRSGERVDRRHVMPKEQLYAPTESPYPFTSKKRCRETHKTQYGQFGRVFHRSLVYGT